MTVLDAGPALAAGGNEPFLACTDADLDAAVAGALIGITEYLQAKYVALHAGARAGGEEL